IIKNIKENIAVSNIRKELDMDKVKDRKIFYKVVLAACAMFVISASAFLNNSESLMFARFIRVFTSSYK
ncbi:MAG: hypothetical protein IJN81_01290, partial [Clostridia bacterium]|nr:hypothetical protein [Clostridia bacterium]